MWPKLGPILSYGPIYLFGIVVHLFLALLWTRRLGLRWWPALVVNACYILGMIVGAKLLFDLQGGLLSWANLCSAEHWRQGGMWGGPLAFLALAVPLAWLVTKDHRAGVDLVALSLPIPMLIAKVACLCHGCCYGRPTDMPWAVTFPAGDGPAPAGVPVHPTQIYEMLVTAATWAVLQYVNRPKWRGTLLFWFLGVYGLGRAGTEVFRGDIKAGGTVGPLTHSQWLCLVASVASFMILLIYHRMHRAAPASVQNPSI
jgi:phosphatidylglycerol---prolipoprotein diacylglyceryl transferase